MTTYYVGPGGNDSNAGTSWAARRLTLNGIEDKPVAAGDTIWVGPGTYRELLTVDVSGSDGSPITYIGDVTGEHTDGIGGLVRITGSDNDTSATRANCIAATSKNYRTFRGFALDSTTGRLILGTTCTDWEITDCWLAFSASSYSQIGFTGAGTARICVRRCLILNNGDMAGYGVYLSHTSLVSDSGCVVENCVFDGGVGTGVYVNYIGGTTVRNCTFHSVRTGVYGNGMSGGQTITVNNCLFTHCGTALLGGAASQITEDYNNLWDDDTERTNVSTGGNSTAYIPQYNPPTLLSGYALPTDLPWVLAPWSALRGKVGSSPSSDDLYGTARPATSAKISWGAVQYNPIVREATTTYDSSTASLELSDAGRYQIRVPVTNASTTISVYVYREANYAGTNPRMIIKQPGQSDRTTTDAGSASTWNGLTDTFTPAAVPGWVTVELLSSNTANSGSYATYFDKLTVT